MFVVNISISISYPFVVATYSHIKNFWWIWIPCLCTMTDLNLVTPTENNKTNLRINIPDVIVIFINLFVYLFSIVRYFWGILSTSFFFQNKWLSSLSVVLKKIPNVSTSCEFFSTHTRTSIMPASFILYFAIHCKKKLYLFCIRFTFSFYAFF